MSTPEIASGIALVQRHPWRPLYWEPVAGTGERLMVGVIHAFNGETAAVRLVRDDLLDALYGNAADGARRLIDSALSMFVAAASASDLSSVGISLMGLHAGPLRETGARSASELLHTAALLYSSLTNLDRIDEPSEADAPQQEDVNRRFSTEVRDRVAEKRPDLASSFGRQALLVANGQRVRFGFLNSRAVVHFAVINAVRQSAGVRDARARLFELQRAQEFGGMERAALIAAIPRDDDPTLGPRQRENLRLNRIEIEREADAVPIRWYSVHTAEDAATRVIELA